VLDLDNDHRAGLEVLRHMQFCSAGTAASQGDEASTCIPLLGALIGIVLDFWHYGQETARRRVSAGHHNSSRAKKGLNPFG
jgi:hypothetical protein